jgi:hypothetical protein
LKATGRIPKVLRLVPPRRMALGALSPIESLAPAWHETFRLLFRPFIGRRWISLSLVCLFLGGGTSTAAFQWGFGSLPVNLHASELLFRVRLAISQHLSLIVLAVALCLGLILGLVYVRCLLRFVLIDAVIKQSLTVGAAWKTVKPLAHSYFLWLLGVLGVALGIVIAAMAVTLRCAGLFPQAGYPWWVGSLLLASELVIIVLLGLLLAVMITVTDDLVAPVMYASGISLRAAWKIVWTFARRDLGTFVFYLVLRFALATLVSVAVLIVLFPVLMGVSSIALVTTALVILALRVVGLSWVWNPLTVIVGFAALSLLTALVFALLSVVGMPGQVYLQNFGVRFIASRVESLGVLCRASASGWRRR